MATLSDTVSQELAKMAQEIARELGVRVDVCRRHVANTPSGDRWVLAINGKPFPDLLDVLGSEANHELIEDYITSLKRA